jgi:transposase
LKRQISRELDRLELILDQIKPVEVERNALLARAEPEVPTPAKTLLDLKGIFAERLLSSDGHAPWNDRDGRVVARAG